jgi:hypothetical protein
MVIPSQCYYTVENVDVCFLQPLFRTTVYRQCVETIQEEPKLKLCTDFNMVKIESRPQTLIGSENYSGT